MLNDKENLLDDLEILRDWQSRPVGETVAMLCAELDLPPDTCVRQGATWLVTRPPSPYERFRETLPPSAHGQGQTAKPSGWGSLDEVHTAVDPATRPHPGRSAFGPSP